MDHLNRMPEKSFTSLFAQQIKDKLKTKRNYWDDPPDFRGMLYIFLFFIAVCSVVLSTIGFRILNEPRSLFQSYLEGRNGRGNSSGLDVCRNGRLNLCPTAPDTDSSLFLPEFWLKPVAAFLGCVGLFDATICFTVFVFAYKNKTKCLFVTLFLIPFAIAAKWKMVDLVVFHMTPVHEAAKDDLVNTFREKFGMNDQELLLIDSTPQNPHITTMNSIMATFECCGIRGPADFQYNRQKFIYDKVLNKSRIFEVPPACCVSPYPKPGVQRFLEHIVDLQCMGPGNYTWDVNKRGCFSAVFDYIYSKYGKIILIILLCVINVQSLQTICTIFVLLRRKKRKHRTSRSAKVSLRSVSEVTGRKMTSNKSEIIRRSFGRGSTFID